MISYIFFIILLLFSILLSIRISIYDYRHRIIPDAYLFPLLLIGLILLGFYNFPFDIITGIIGATFGYITSATLGFIFDRALQRRDKNSDTPIGMGDIKLISVGGLWLGTTGLAVALIISGITGAIWARRKKQKFIPFAPFFIFGGFLSFIINLFLL